MQLLMSMEEILHLTSIPNKTKSATDWVVWSDWATCPCSLSSDGKCSVDAPLLSMPAEDFAYWLGKYFIETRKKKDGIE